MDFGTRTIELKHYVTLTIILLLSITLVAFFPTFHNDFQRGWDDSWQLLENPFVLDPTWGNIKFHFTNFYRGQYSPVNTLMYIGVNNLYGFDPFYFHLSCFLLHLTNVILVFQFIKRITKILKPGYNERRIISYAFFVALIFAVHPLQVESVAWISASKIVLYSFFFLSALICYLQYLKTRKLFWLFVIAGLYLLGFGSKEQAIILPLNFIVLDYVFGRFHGLKLKTGTLRASVLLEKIPFFLMALSFWYFSYTFNLGVIGGEDNYPFYQRVLMGMHSLNQYIFRFLAPVKLYYFYFFPVEKGGQLPLYYWGYCLLTAIIGGFLYLNYRKKNKIVIFGALFFLVNILLVLHILPMPRKMITADRYMYISIIGLGFILVWVLDYLMVKFQKHKSIVILSVIYIICLGGYTFSRTQDWKNSETVKRNVAEIIEERKKADQPLINNPLSQNRDE